MRLAPRGEIRATATPARDPDERDLLERRERKVRPPRRSARCPPGRAPRDRSRRPRARPGRSARDPVRAERRVDAAAEEEPEQTRAAGRPIARGHDDPAVALDGDAHGVVPARRTTPSEPNRRSSDPSLVQRATTSPSDEVPATRTAPSGWTAIPAAVSAAGPSRGAPGRPAGSTLTATSAPPAEPPTTERPAASTTRPAAVSSGSSTAPLSPNARSRAPLPSRRRSRTASPLRPRSSERPSASATAESTDGLPPGARGLTIPSAPKRPSRAPFEVSFATNQRSPSSAATAPAASKEPSGHSSSAVASVLEPSARVTRAFDPNLDSTGSRCGRGARRRRFPVSIQPASTTPPRRSTTPALGAARCKRHRDLRIGIGNGPTRRVESHEAEPRVVPRRGDADAAVAGRDDTSDDRICLNGRTAVDAERPDQPPVAVQPHDRHTRPPREDDPAVRGQRDVLGAAVALSEVESEDAVGGKRPVERAVRAETDRRVAALSRRTARDDGSVRGDQDICGVRVLADPGHRPPRCAERAVDSSVRCKAPDHDEGVGLTGTRARKGPRIGDGAGHDDRSVRLDRGLGPGRIGAVPAGCPLGRRARRTRDVPAVGAETGEREPSGSRIAGEVGLTDDRDDEDRPVGEHAGRERRRHLIEGRLGATANDPAVPEGAIGPARRAVAGHDGDAAVEAGDDELPLAVEHGIADAPAEPIVAHSACDAERAVRSARSVGTDRAPATTR